MVADAGAQTDAVIDTDRIHQLLVNLLGNAGQHGAPERVIRLLVGGDSDQVLLRVINDGPEIPAASLKRIFDPMAQLNSATKLSSGAVGSLGLGLHIALQIAEGHGGTIVAESDNSQTTFTVRLPRHGRAG